MRLDLSPANAELYRGLEIRELAGKPTLVSPPDLAIPGIVGNLARMPIDADEVILTGSMAIWAYLVVFHYLHGKTKRIYYEDGRGQRILVAAHG
ncbi:MAG: hypothetical protein FJ280_23005 [Planctomycetes bacterium]|nr:hypothetical protein [Planctomycetota bacterium]